MSTFSMQPVREAIENGYNFDFGEYFNRGFDIFKRDVGSFVGYTLVYILILAVVQFIPFLGTLVNLVVAYPLYVGFHLVAQKISFGESYDFNSFFKGFDAVGQLVIMYLIYLVASIILIAIPASLAFVTGLIGPNMETLGSIDTNDPSYIFELLRVVRVNALAVFLIVLPVLYFIISWRWAPLLIVFHGFSAWEAMESSRKLIGKQFFLVAAFIIVVSILTGLGVVALLVGVLFTQPLALCCDYAAFEDVTGMKRQDADDTERIEEHLVD